jgi:hypothetical protein
MLASPFAVAKYFSGGALAFSAHRLGICSGAEEGPNGAGDFRGVGLESKMAGIQ